MKFLYLIDNAGGGTSTRDCYCQEALAERGLANARFKAMNYWKDCAVEEPHRGYVKGPLLQQAKTHPPGKITNEVIVAELN